jgi:hypothetical protein
MLFMMTSVFAQKTEVRISLNSGLFSFTGESAEKTSWINYDDRNKRGYTNNPYGSRSGFSYGASVNVKQIVKRRLIAGLDLGYEILRSKISINGISGYTGTSTYQIDATGQTFLSSNSINLNPFIGYRMNIKKVNIDLTGGFDFAFINKINESGEAKADNLVYHTDVDRQTIKRDTRPRLQVSADYKRFGISLGKSFGLANYTEGRIGGTNLCYARITRLGFTYKLR